MRPLFKKVVFISNSHVDAGDLARLDGLYDEFVQRENVGFDFAAWRDGLVNLGWDSVQGFDSATLMNDSCFGPIYPLQPVFAKMEAKAVDFWGLVDHDPTLVGMPGTNGPVPRHLQSNFVCYRSAVLKSNVFRSFWDGVVTQTDITRVIQDYETQLTGLLVEAQFSYASVFDAHQYASAHTIVDVYNYSECYPLVLIDAGVPFVKIKAFTHTRYDQIVRRIRRRSSYPTELISGFLKHTELDIVGTVPSSLRRLGSKALGRLRSNDVVQVGLAQLPSAGPFRAVKSKLSPNTARPRRVARRQLIDSDLRYRDVYDADLGEKQAQHRLLVHDTRTYFFEPGASGTYHRGAGDPRVVAFYTPEFQEVPNPGVPWAKRLSGWTDIAAAVPRFVGDQQPALPAELGFYDSRSPDKLKEQIDLATKYGIYGFQFFYYWSGGRKILDGPVSTLLEHVEWDFHFSICWANGECDGRSDRNEGGVALPAPQRPGDALRFIKDVAPILNSPRYITEDGQPILTVSRVDLLDDPARYAGIWRKYFRDQCGKELWLIGCAGVEAFDPATVGFDASMDYSPLDSLNSALKPWVSDSPGKTVEIDESRLLDINWRGEVFDYRYIAHREIANLPNNLHRYRTVSPSWSNESRVRGGDGTTFVNSNPELFAYWLDAILDDEIVRRTTREPIVFINAWNGWGQAAMLEPSANLGHSTLTRVAEVVSKYSHDPRNIQTFAPYRLRACGKSRLAVVVHLFYPNMWPAFAARLANIDLPFDLFLNVALSHAGVVIDQISSYHQATNIIPVPNRGRDVLPFLMTAQRLRVLRQYDYVLKLDTKKSPKPGDGGIWLHEVLDDLLPDDLSEVWSALAKDNTGVIGPRRHLVRSHQCSGGENAGTRRLLTQMTTRPTIHAAFQRKDTNPFGGTMFWCRSDFLEPFLDLHLMPGDFPAEVGQDDPTMARAVDRLLGQAWHRAESKVMYAMRGGHVTQVGPASSVTEHHRFAG